MASWGREGRNHDAFQLFPAWDVSEAINLADATTRFIAGGTDLVNLMKENVIRPARLIDITGLGLDEVEELPDGGLRIGALVSNADLAWHPLIERRYPLLSQAILAGASPQLRNMAGAGGNLLQRTRCYYFYDTGSALQQTRARKWLSARSGFNRIHAILGASDACVATHPSDMCVALAALDAVVPSKARPESGVSNSPTSIVYLQARLNGTINWLTMSWSRPLSCRPLSSSRTIAI